MWTIQQARATYNLARWSDGYFDINAQGNLVAHPDRRPDGDGVDLPRLVDELHAQGLSLPVLVRFTDILRDRVDTLVDAFGTATAADNYTGHYTAVYPIKVNQQRRVVEEILAHGNGRVGLEAGSKPELMAVLALAPDGGVIICNGYKDREYIRLALIGRALGQRIYIVIEKLSELALVMEESRTLGVRPLLGLRVRLASISAGKWQNTGGDKAKFGLSASQILQLVEQLRGAQLLDCLQLLHFHLGSQVANIRDMQHGMREAARFYVEMRALGVPLQVVDVGGGLGVDYEGTASRSFCSINYSVEEYARNIVHSLWEACTEHKLPHPDLISESGRALTAHHAVLITNVTDIDTAPGETASDGDDSSHTILRDLAASLRAIDDADARSPAEIHHEAAHWLSEVQAMYVLGIITLAQRARAEELFYAICHRVRKLLNPASRAHRDLLEELNEKLADKYFCNFSVFQSMPDVWAIDQIFPVLPLHRLNEEPTRRAVIEDLTCDSDGRIDHYVDQDGIETSLPLHTLRANEPYLLGFFMVGAYQEILGDMHNLFGDTDSVNVVLDAQQGYRLEEPQRGDTVDELLRYVHFEPERLLEAYRRKVEKSALDAGTSAKYISILEAGLDGYTYLED